MWPLLVDWQQLRFGVEIEFVGGSPNEVELLPGWEMSLHELQIDQSGSESGSELKPPPIRWEDREQLKLMLSRLQAQKAEANWSCGLHVHVGLEPWGQQIVLPLIEAALQYQESIRALLQTSEHRSIFCPPVTEVMRQRFMNDPKPSAVRNWGRPQSHRCGINTAAWFDIGTVEVRYANGSLEYEEVINTIELCLRFVSAIGAGRKLPQNPMELAIALGAPVDGYPPQTPAPRWFRERTWLEEALMPLLTPLINDLVPDGELHHILPVPGGLLVAVETSDGELVKFTVRPPNSGWEVLPLAQD